METFKSIASALKKPEKVTKLYLNGGHYDKFPEELFKLENLEELTFDYCYIKTISTDITKLRHLKIFNVLVCWGLTDIPREVFLIPSLEQGSFAYTDIEKKDKREKQALIEHIGSKKIPLHIREALVAFIYEIQPTIDKWTIEQLIGALNAPISIIQHAAKKEIEKRNKILFNKNPPKAHSKIVLLGKFKSGYNTLADHLKSLDIKTTKKIADDTHYIVLAEKPGEISLQKIESLQIITENQLLSFLNAQSPLKTKEICNEETKENLGKLLQNQERSNYSIAFEIINRHGLPEGMITELFAYWVISNDKVFRDLAKNALNIYGSPALQKMMSKIYQFKNYGEETINDLITEFDKNTEIDGMTLAEILYSKAQQGKLYLFANGNDKIRLEVAEILINDKSLKKNILENGDDKVRQDIIKIMMNDNSISFSMLYLNRFPIEILNFPNLKKLSLRTGKFFDIPDMLGNLMELEVLDLGATNMVKEFPKLVLKLKNLKYLSLSFTSYDLPESLKSLEKLECLELVSRNMKVLPEWLAEMQSLKYLNIQGNLFPKKNPVPEVLFKMPFLEELTNDFPAESENFKKLQERLSKTRFSSSVNMINRYFPLV